MPVKTRFAPSPTGYLHIGGVRTALFSWLYAKKAGGKFLLRIEDTDRERSTQESVNAILDGMQWLGMDYDEGPIYQTDRFDRYHDVIQKLIQTGHAYACDCSTERLDKMREQQRQAKTKPRYDGCCRERSDVDTSAAHVIRFKNPSEGNVEFPDCVRGDISVSNAELDDLIIARTDGSPTYNLTVVVDDMDMNVSHVIRGDDHINNTPRQINILRALGATPPVYAHVPMILGSDSKRLSKRHGAVSVIQYRDEGILPEALLNYLVRLGWSHGDKEIFSLQEMIELFDLKDVNKSPSAFSLEKLLWLNQHYMKAAEKSRVRKLYEQFLESANLSPAVVDDIDSVIGLTLERSQSFVQMVENSRFFFDETYDYDAKAAKKNLKVAAKAPLQALSNSFSTLEWKKELIHPVIEKVVNDLGVGFGKVALPLRVALTGNTISPSIEDVVYLIGKKSVLSRIERALEYIAAREAQS